MHATSIFYIPNRRYATKMYKRMQENKIAHENLSWQISLHQKWSLM